MNTPPSKHEEEIFAAAAALPESERAAHLDAVCGDDHELRKRVGRRLALHEASGFMEELPETLRSEIEEQFARLKPEEAGERIGNYKLLEQIGEGGFGTVWVADQEQPVRRRVALKIIKLGMDTKDVIARFEQERQALAVMDHPNIAKVFDAGATLFGRPFFVMELVHGTRITDYCDEAKLPTAERLQLFIAVCQAVQHAHQKGIIHRDLKPSNILVTLQDGVPVPKVIDFGVAKAMHGRLTEAAITTNLEQMIGTPLYMSPEQAEMNGVDVDTRSDIYSLGVLLFELLTGRTPFTREDMLKASYKEMRRLICEVEPKKPSTALQTMEPQTATAVASRRQCEAAKLARLVHGDLDWIVMKTLEKDRARRYETASGLALDIQRHLSSETVLARPPSVICRLQKMVRRNRVACVATIAVVVSLLAGTAISIWQATVANRAKNDAISAQAEAEVSARKEIDAIAALAWAGVSPPHSALGEGSITIDREFQRIVESKLGEASQRLQPIQSTSIWIRCQTGEVLALADLRKDGPPYGDIPYNSLIRLWVIEPGSVFKPIVAALAINDGKVTPDTKIWCHQGLLYYPGGQLRDHHPYGSLTVSEVLQKSSNIGVVKVGLELGPNKLYEGLRAFGFGRRTVIPLVEEASGVLQPLGEWRDTAMYHIPFGHEAAVTPIQAAMAMNVFASGGRLLMPKVYRPNRVEESGPDVGKDKEQAFPISDKVAAQMREILTGVTMPGGTAPRARIPGFRVAGVSGSFQKFDPESKRYSEDKHIVSFIGFFPAEAPVLLGLVIIDQPNVPGATATGGLQAAPIFSAIGQEAARHFGLVPEPKLLDVEGQAPPAPLNNGEPKPQKPPGAPR